MKYLSLTLLVLVLGFSACDLDVVPPEDGEREVIFTATPEIPLEGMPMSCDTPCVVNISNTSTQTIPEFSWDFDNNTIANTRDPAPVTYSAYGSYTITMAAFNSAGDSLGTAPPVTINVLDPVADPVASFSVQNDGCFVPCTLTFENTSTNAGSYTWDFRDGSEVLNTTSSTAVTHRYEKAGDYRVSLIARNGLKTDSAFHDVAPQIWTKSQTLGGSGRGEGRFVLQSGSHEYVVVGSENGTFGNLYVQRISHDNGGVLIADAPRIISTDRPVKVADAVLLQGGTVGVALYGSPMAGDKFRTAFYELDINATTTSFDVSFFTELPAFDDYDLIPTSLTELPNGNVLMVGQANRTQPTSGQIIFYRTFTSSQSLVNPTREIGLAGALKYTVGQVDANADHWCIALEENNNGTRSAKVAVIDADDPASFIMVNLGANLKTASRLQLRNTQAFVAGDDHSNGTFLARFALPNGAVTRKTLSSSQIFEQDMSWDRSKGRLLLAGQENGKARFWVLDTTLNTLFTSTPFGSGSEVYFQDVIETIDCGFFAVGGVSTSGNTDKLFFAKTNEGGRL